MPVSNTIYNKIKTTIVSVGTSATPLPTTPLNSRSTVVVQNLSNNEVHLGDSTVTTTGATRGIVLPSKFSTMKFDLIDCITLHGVADSTSDVVIFEGA